MAENIMKKARLAGTDPNLSLLDYRNTPTEGLGDSPAQRKLVPCEQRLSRNQTCQSELDVTKLLKSHRLIMTPMHSKSQFASFLLFDSNKKDFL